MPNVELSTNFQMSIFFTLALCCGTFSVIESSLTLLKENDLNSALPWSTLAGSDSFDFLSVARAVYYSSDTGHSWHLALGQPSVAWSSLACSSDGSRVYAGANLGGIYVSIVYGGTWVQTAALPRIGEA